MSGWVCIVNLDGAPVEPEVIWQLTRTMGFRGPDREAIEVFGSVALGHTLLRTTFEAEREIQPCTLNGESWIVGDCRIDARTDLMRELRQAGRIVDEATDPELILHAYAAWGKGCTEHLLGDFSFAIYDGARRTMFFARDQIGVKLLYYARFGKHFVFGNTIHTLLSHPGATKKLNDLAIADFLIFGMNQDAETTAFEDVRRLLPAHRAVLRLTGGTGGANAPGIERYWTLPIDEPLRLRRRSDYPEYFRSLLLAVVGDRLRTDRVAIQMSGGLDSGTMAAAAQRFAAKSGGSLTLNAYTNVFDRIIPDQERHYAGLTAAHLGIPVQFLAGDDDRFYEDYPRGVPLPDPAFISLLGPNPPSGILNVVAGDGARVSLFGEGPDNALSYEWKPYVAWEMNKRHFASLARDILSFPFLFGTLPIMGRLSAAPRASLSVDGIPTWLCAGLIERLHLRERLRNPPVWDGGPPEHPTRPDGYSSFRLQAWPMIFEGLDCAVSRVPVEVRHPFMDIRMLRFLLSLPALPWCRDKFVMRRAMRGWLPAEITERPKTGMRGWPFFSIWREQPSNVSLLRSSLGQTGWSGAAFSDYVDMSKLTGDTSYSYYSLGVNLRPRALAFFLQSLS